MLRNSAELIGRSIAALDGHIGSVVDLLLEDTTWHVRWAVVDTGHWLPGKRVLLSPQQLAEAPDEPGAFRVELTTEQIRNSPDASTDHPVSRDYEEQLFAYYQTQPYWLMAAPVPLPPPLPLRTAEASHGDPHLRSVSDLHGLPLHATDGMIGHIEHVLVELANWAVPAIEVDTGGWLTGRLVLVAPAAITRIDETEVCVALTRAQVEGSPRYQPRTPVGFDLLGLTYGYYGVPWIMPAGVSQMVDDTQKDPE